MAKVEIITALDLDSSGDALAAVERCGACQWFKVGLQLFSREGPAAVGAVKEREKSVFLDLKLHDIPNTVAKAAAAATDLGADLMTVHAAGGRAMIEAARKSVDAGHTRILAVTVLTSISENVLRDEVGIPETPADAVARFAKQSVEAGAHGIVCSPLEIEVVREAVGPDALIVTPGVRPAWASKDDQARVMTPADAARAGATHIVVGRPILGHDDPAEAVRLINEELNV